MGSRRLAERTLDGCAGSPRSVPTMEVAGRPAAGLDAIFCSPRTDLDQLAEAP